ncbi:MAG TPA: hypothetical protein VKB34_03300 [Povalibacter sp.]|nr:hypothetical protein [Povalibacter sp.]
MPTPSIEPLPINEAARDDIVTRKVTCPFLGSAVASGVLAVRNSSTQPLASIDDVVKLGNSGKDSDLGSLLKIFCEGNHAFMPGPSGIFDEPVLSGLFSLDLPGSQGSHFGHSGILQGSPRVAGSGRFSETEFNRFMKFAHDDVIRRSDIGKFIADNIARDSAAHAPGVRTAVLLTRDLLALAGQVVDKLKDKVSGRHDAVEDRQLFTRLTKLLGEDNLVGSAGEFGLLAAFLANSPRTRRVGTTLGTEPAYAVADITMMFRDHRLPDGWELWTKKASEWVASTAAIAAAAEKEFLSRRANQLF